MKFATKEAERAHNKLMYTRHKVKIMARRKRYRLANPEKYKAQARASGLRISRKKLAAPIPYEAPENCEACGIKFADAVRGPYLDHDHATNLFRGWLCHKCNSAIGLAGDTREGVQKLLNYLNKLRYF